MDASGGKGAGSATGVRGAKGAKGAQEAKGAMDTVALHGLKVYGNHGVFQHERDNGQIFVIDLVMRLDTSPAAAGDDLARTVHYGVVAEEVAAVVSGEPVDLIETLAQRIADTCLGHEAVQEVEVTVHKPDAPIAVPFDDVTVTITRRRP